MKLHNTELSSGTARPDDDPRFSASADNHKNNGSRSAHRAGACEPPLPLVVPNWPRVFPGL